VQQLLNTLVVDTEIAEMELQVCVFFRLSHTWQLVLGLVTPVQQGSSARAAAPAAAAGPQSASLQQQSTACGFDEAAWPPSCFEWLPQAACRASTSTAPLFSSLSLPLIPARTL
jgi:hypothetical protein